MIYDCFRVTDAHNTELDYADLFSVTLYSDKDLEFDTKWHEVSSSMSKIPSDDVLTSLYKLKMSESEQFKIVEFYDIEIHQKKSIPNKNWKSWWKEV